MSLLLSSPADSSYQETRHYQSGQRWTYQEMRQKPAPRDTFFSLRNEAQDLRPVSVATEFVDTDWDEETFSEPEDNSPRVSLQSSGQPSITTLSSFEEAITPRSSQDVNQTQYTSTAKRQVEGPRGPHLFRNSAEQVSADGDITLTLSPITPKTPRDLPDLWYQSELQPPVPDLPSQCNTPFQFSSAELDVAQLVMWTPEMVAQSMLEAGLEPSVAARFIENDINGPILSTLKFEDLRELGISSFGIRIRVWNQIQVLRDSHAASPRAPTPIEEAPSREARSEERRHNRGPSRSSSAHRRTRKKSSASSTSHGSHEANAITPGESVSIIGIEQVIPKPHICSKGIKCSKWRKQVRLIEQFKQMNPGLDITNNNGGTVLIAGDAGNPETARAINPDEPFRPMSDAEPSVVASSDIMGPGNMPGPMQYLKENNLRSVQNRDPQDNVIRFLQFQDHGANEFPPTPPFEQPDAPYSQQPHQGLRRLPRLAIPGTNTSQAVTNSALPRASTMPIRQQQQQQQQQQHRRASYQQMARADARSPELDTPPSAKKPQASPDRYGTPFSEVDVPVTAVPIGPVARDASQSVPPSMNYYYHADIAASRSIPLSTTPAPRAPSRLARTPGMPSVEEHARPQTTSPEDARRTSPQLLSQPQRAPPRGVYPWSPVERTNFEMAIPPLPSMNDGSSGSSTTVNINGVTHQGPMKRRKAKLLRHEWEDGYFTLKGTRLNMHKDKNRVDRTLEYVDIDDYAIACSSLASSSKLSAAFKAMRNSSSTHLRDRSDPVGAFQFQLIPQEKGSNGQGGNTTTSRLRKRESASPATQSSSSIQVEGVNGTGKTHHFAVKSRDDRIDWMRELMLAKALKQKGEGFEVSVNGNMI
ncbi:SAM protein [Geosmithia morbida]|uniref:SAM protein n=1 Tax=Geosmithia morbida TaxID=1094350 RepID=A0A9P5D6F5_9HYPO|nr:SAM protein [Geosmithia morbida]KAF4123454.1 SAM protein [Geosmithia morbida]